MKKNFINMAMATLVAFGTVAYTGCTKEEEPVSGCTNQADDNYNSEAEVSDATACDPSGTDSKFVGNWTFQISGAGTYSVVITDASAEYAVTANTNLGLDNVNAQNISLSVSQKEATNNSVTLGNATVSNLKFEWRDASNATLSGTISGTGIAGVDGNFSDNGTK